MQPYEVLGCGSDANITRRGNLYAIALAVMSGSETISV